jgi:tetratricopeptide (TPR) repeat protein
LRVVERGLPVDGSVAGRLQSGRAAEAEEAYAEATRLDPLAALAHFNRGVALERLERWDEALEAYRCARALRPDLPEVGRAILRALLRLGRFDEADEALATLR